MESDLNHQRGPGSWSGEDQNSPALCTGVWYGTRELREEQPSFTIWGLHFLESFRFLRQGWAKMLSDSYGVREVSLWMNCPQVLYGATFLIPLATGARLLGVWGIITDTSHIKTRKWNHYSWWVISYVHCQLLLLSLPDLWNHFQHIS